MDNVHPLFGKATICHQCGGEAVWVFNGGFVGNYHYCRKCKVETGPFAKSSPPARPDPLLKFAAGDAVIFAPSATTPLWLGPVAGTIGVIIGPDTSGYDWLVDFKHSGWLLLWPCDEEELVRVPTPIPQAAGVSNAVSP